MKRKLTEDLKPDFMEYAIKRKAKYPFDMNITHLTEEILSRTFDFFVRHRLAVHDNAKSYWYKGGKIQDECLGYSGYSINERDNMDTMIDNLFHEVWCKAEWLARGKDSFYVDVCKQCLGVSEFNKICG